MAPGRKAEFDSMRIAKAFLRSIQRIVPTKYEYREVDGSKYVHVSQRYYAKTAETLRTMGFRLLGDIEDSSILKTAPFDPRTFMRVMVDAPGTTVAQFYQIAPVLKWRVAMFFLRFPTKYLDLFSLGENGTTYGTSNKPEKAVFPKPEWATRQLVPRRTTAEEMYGRHRQMLTGLAAPLRPFRTLADVMRAQSEVRARQRAYLEQIGWVTKDYLRLNRVPELHVDAVYDDLQQLLRDGFIAAN
jgi:hypothetical protein